MRFCGAIGVDSVIVGICIEACQCKISRMLLEKKPPYGDFAACPGGPYARHLYDKSGHTMPQGNIMVIGLHVRLLASIWSSSLASIHARQDKYRPDRTNIGQTGQTTDTVNTENLRGGGGGVGGKLMRN